MVDAYNKKIPVLRNMCEFPYIMGSPTTASSTGRRP